MVALCAQNGQAPVAFVRTGAVLLIQHGKVLAEHSRLSNGQGGTKMPGSAYVTGSSAHLLVTASWRMCAALVQVLYPYLTILQRRSLPYVLTQHWSTQDWSKVIARSAGTKCLLTLQPIQAGPHHLPIGAFDETITRNFVRCVLHVGAVRWTALPLCDGILACILHVMEVVENVFSTVRVAEFGTSAGKIVVAETSSAAQMVK